MKNPVVKALAEATPRQVEEALSEILEPFNKYGISNFPSLLQEFEHRDRFMQKRLKIEEEEKAKKSANAQRKAVAENLAKAGIKDAEGKDVSPDSAIVEAYIRLPENRRAKFIAESLGRKIKSEKQSVAPPQEQEQQAAKEVADRIGSIFTPLKEQAEK